jgi:hypothetical protein
MRVEQEAQCMPRMVNRCFLIDDAMDSPLIVLRFHSKLRIRSRKIICA